MRTWLFSGLLTLALCGCAGYRLGPTGGQVSGARSIQVVPFVNKTLEPRLGESVTSSLRKEVQRDGTFRLNTRDEGDIIISGTLLNYDRASLSYQPTDVITPRDYRLGVVAQVVARERGTGRVILDQKVEGHSSVRVGADLASLERQTLPLIAEDLARKIITLLADGSW